jgi:hypothetical protein
MYLQRLKEQTNSCRDCRIVNDRKKKETVFSKEKVVDILYLKTKERKKIKEFLIFIQIQH